MGHPTSALARRVGEAKALVATSPLHQATIPVPDALQTEQRCR